MDRRRVFVFSQAFHKKNVCATSSWRRHGPTSSNLFKALPVPFSSSRSTNTRHGHGLHRRCPPPISTAAALHRSPPDAVSSFTDANPSRSIGGKGRRTLGRSISTRRGLLHHRPAPPSSQSPPFDRTPPPCSTVVAVAALRPYSTAVAETTESSFVRDCRGLACVDGGTAPGTKLIRNSTDRLGGNPGRSSGNTSAKSFTTSTS
ncbi:hypothetical protein E3N88_23138 [Mikania micrantha]|uniref:Uncharacterized protein n=1 Tax=Mikania micrantha TaxID=192012 RepID=A0A5N6NE68_9ASTR|nr:hypothetical protein E3N88_23138 [Mikania micrantha]